MKLVGQGKKDRNTPYSFRTFYAAPKYNISFAQAFGNRTLHMIFNVNVGGVWGTALMDSGATHSFVRASFLNTLGIRANTESVNIQLADGQTMKSAGTARLRLHLAAHITDQRKFIVCDTLLDGVDVILGQDFLRARGVILNYGNNMCYLRAKHNYVTLSNTPTHYWGNQRRGPPKVVGAVTACR
eukprot:jgi/Botrbrau1/14711/Bobra.0108s0061.1